MKQWQKFFAWFQQGIDVIRTISSSVSDAPDAWEWSIARFEADDRQHPPPEGAIVFTGSSSITFWDTLEQDMDPLPILNRGFGGSKIQQVVYYVDRIVIPYHPRAVVLFAGTNDIAGPKPKTAQEVLAGFQAFVQAVHTSLPGTPIYYIAITPTPSRWKLWPIAQEANRLIQAFVEINPCLHYIDLTEQLLTPDSLPDRHLYRMDQLHPNIMGYKKWVEAIKPVLLKDFND